MFRIYSGIDQSTHLQRIQVSIYPSVVPLNWYQYIYYSDAMHRLWIGLPVLDLLQRNRHQRDELELFDSRSETTRAKAAKPAKTSTVC